VTQSSATSLRGVIIPAEWNEQGNPTAVSLAADDQQEYRIHNGTPEGRLLLDLLNHRVEIDVYRHLQSERSRPRVIAVIQFRVLDDIRARSGEIIQ